MPVLLTRRTPAPDLTSVVALVSAESSVNVLLVTKKVYPSFDAVVTPAKPVSEVLFAAAPVERKAPEVSANVSVPGPVRVTAAAVESMTRELIVLVPPAAAATDPETVKRTLLLVVTSRPS